MCFLQLELQTKDSIDASSASSRKELVYSATADYQCSGIRVSVTIIPRICDYDKFNVNSTKAIIVL